MNRFTVAPGRETDFEAAWAERESYLDQVPGFLTFSLLRGEAGVFISHSTWENEAAFTAWTESDAFVRAHRQRLPEGVLAGPPEFAGYQVVLSQGAGSVRAASV
ncbi:MAG: antibiotic biosynthesis monooxygenase family protein [Leptospirillia bacterium]